MNLQSPFVCRRAFVQSRAPVDTQQDEEASIVFERGRDSSIHRAQNNTTGVVSPRAPSTRVFLLMQALEKRAENWYMCQGTLQTTCLIKDILESKRVWFEASCCAIESQTSVIFSPRNWVWREEKSFFENSIVGSFKDYLWQETAIFRFKSWSGDSRHNGHLQSSPHFMIFSHSSRNENQSHSLFDRNQFFVAQE